MLEITFDENCEFETFQPGSCGTVLLVKQSFESGEKLHCEPIADNLVKLNNGAYLFLDNLPISVNVLDNVIKVEF